CPRNHNPVDMNHISGVGGFLAVAIYLRSSMVMFGRMQYAPTGAIIFNDIGCRILVETLHATSLQSGQI
ncbi:MAG: hypothetical protein LBT35_00790, partial [Tannerella sp.]|nr:hypothetical protein [Tannerella sp.]